MDGSQCYSRHMLISMNLENKTTRLNFIMLSDPLERHVYVIKLGFTGVYIFSLFLL